METSATPYDSVLARVVRDASRPLVTDIDVAASERVELSVSSVANGAAKAAHLVADLAADIGGAPRIALRLPLHWQVVTFALGAWAAGAQLVVDGTAALTADAVVLGPTEAMDPPHDLPDVVWGTRLHAFGLSLSPLPAFPVEDLTLALRAQPDAPPVDTSDVDEAAVVVDGVATTMAELLERATELGLTLGENGRLLTCLPWSSLDGWVVGVALPALADRSVVLLRGWTGAGDQSALERLCAAEQVVATAGVDVADLPRLC